MKSTRASGPSSENGVARAGVDVHDGVGLEQRPHLVPRPTRDGVAVGRLQPLHGDHRARAGVVELVASGRPVEGVPRRVALGDDVAGRGQPGATERQRAGGGLAVVGEHEVGVAGGRVDPHRRDQHAGRRRRPRRSCPRRRRPPPRPPPRPAPAPHVRRAWSSSSIRALLTNSVNGTTGSPGCSDHDERRVTGRRRGEGGGPRLPDGPVAVAEHGVEVGRLAAACPTKLSPISITPAPAPARCAP